MDGNCSRNGWGPATAGLALLATLGACAPGGSGGGGSARALDAPATDGEAARFLTQATFGPMRGGRTGIDRLRQVGVEAWLADQRDAVPSLSRPALTALAKQGAALEQQDRLDLWWEHAVTGEDQLRQRVAFALSQIFVISDEHDALSGDPVGMAEFYDLLVRNALGDYRELLEQVTLSPQMGSYLSMLQNGKGDPGANVRPDENYAREVLQLFSIGLVELHPDGAPVLDGAGEPVPTYDQAVVEALAAGFTGWTWANASSFWDYQPGWKPMENWNAHHDHQSKSVLAGAVLAAGQNGEEDLHQVLDLIAAHPNVGPFVGKHLIQRLVTSNPSPAYVARVTQAWNQAPRGNLFRVVSAILTDPEARTGHLADPAGFGKLKEPVLRLTGLWRALGAGSKSGTFRMTSAKWSFGQSPLGAPSVFNFYSPDHSPPGELSATGLVAPEMQITTHSMITNTTNELLYRALWYTMDNPQIGWNDVAIDFAPLAQHAGDLPALLRELDVLFLGGRMDAETRQILRGYLETISVSDGGRRRALEGVWAVVTSPDAAVQQ